MSISKSVKNVLCQLFVANLVVAMTIFRNVANLYNTSRASMQLFGEANSIIDSSPHVVANNRLLSTHQCRVFFIFLEW